ncbi:MAG: YeeE/YedE family protein [Rhodovarius sp.]|nr:YeeE/YedE family protein [Rhodovarius sp.]
MREIILPARLLRGLPAALLLIAGGLWLHAVAGPRQALLWAIGAGLGAVLLLARFGFTGAFRRLFHDGRSEGLRAQLLLIALVAGSFLPLLALGEVGGVALRGYVFPVGVALLIGAFLFGIGMQLGGGCGSGTLYAAGAGLPRLWITLAAFIAGATLAAWQAPLWQDLPALPPLSLPALFGTGPALALSLGLLAVAALAARARERARHGRVAPMPPALLAGAVGLALLSVATLLVAGRPWAITAAFPLWGSHLVAWAGWDDPSFWPYWEDPTRIEAFLRPLWADRITVMDVGLMVGAALAAALAGRLAPWRLPRPGEVLASLIGGLLLGVGAVLASGCNISAYVGGIASGSLHGWVWILPALAGNWVGARLRPLFRLD